MPFKIVDEQERFTFETTPGGLPIAHVTRWGNGVWVKCCPLCGMLHEILKGQTAGEFEPKCIARVTHPKVFAAWQQKHPDAAKHRTVMLTNVDIQPAPQLVPKPDIAAPAAKPTRRTRKAA